MDDSFGDQELRANGFQEKIVVIAVARTPRTVRVALDNLIPDHYLIVRIACDSEYNPAHICHSLRDPEIVPGPEQLR